MPPTAVGSSQAQTLSKQGALESMTLLKNDPRVLPFAPGQSIAVIGPNANSSDNLLGNCTCWLPHFSFTNVMAVGDNHQ